MQKNRTRRRRTVLLMSSGGLILISLVYFGYSLAKSIPKPERISERNVVESTKIYDRTGKVVLYEIHGEEKRTVIKLQDVPKQVRDATLAAEDLHFYEHGGIDFRGILRALFVNISRGDISQGGSTITQQLVKNSVLTSERTFQRKIKEAILAILVERKYSKAEIFELYLNQIPYGSNAYGIASAAQTFFGKDAKDLSVAESALLASLPKAPTYYSPYGTHKEEILARKDWVIDRMKDAGFITPAEASAAKKTVLEFAPPKQAIRAPHFVMYVREYLSEKYGEGFIEQGGLKVTTSLDWTLQEEAEKIVKEGAEQNDKTVAAANASLVAIDPKTGEVLAMVGSRDYFEKPLPEGCNPGVSCRFDPHVNVSLRYRQPGSSFKPFVYATAFKKGYTPETVLFDVPTEFNSSCNPDGSPGPLIKDPKECYHPKDYDGNFRGPVSLRQSLAQSLNIPSVKLLYLAGVKDSIDTALQMGITSIGDADRYGLTLVLGGAEVSLLEMTSAFGAFSQDGILHPKTSILRVETPQGEVLEEKKDISLPVLDTNIARTINSVLSDNDARVPVFNPRSSLYFPDRPVAAKTGTTQDYRDAWVIGYTPSIAVGVWAGNNDNTPMNKSALSVMVAAPMWHKFLAFAVRDTPPEDFVPPDPSSPDKLTFRGVYRSGTPVKIDKISKKLANEYTPPDLVEEQSFGPIKTILYFVDKNNPSGDLPANPQNDSQFYNWQAGIDRWLAEHPLPAGSPPTVYDDLHTLDKRPHIDIISVSPGDKTASVRVRASFPLREVSLFINDELQDSKTAPITSEVISFDLKNYVSGKTNTIKITAYDAAGNKETLTKDFSD